MTTTTRPKLKRRHVCARCGRKLRTDRSVYSRWTGARYCWPGAGCQRAKAADRC